jgi:ABC-2 type transport system permease protein
MFAVVRAELLGLRTVRSRWLLAASAVLLTCVLAIMPVVDSGKAGRPSVGTAGAMLAVLGAVGAGRFVVLLFGVLTVTGEFRHGTVTATFLQTPRRVQVLASKAAATVLVGLALAVVDAAVVLAIGLSTGAVQPSLLNGDITLRVLGLLLAYPVYGLLGIGVGALVIYQPPAVLLPLAWVLYLEDLVVHLIPRTVQSWSLGNVTSALANAGDVRDVLPVLGGGLVLLTYAVLFLCLGIARVVHRDIT